MHHTRSLLCTAQEEREDDDEDEQDNKRAIQLSSVDRREPTHKYNDNFAKCITLPGVQKNAEPRDTLLNWKQRPADATPHECRQSGVGDKS